MTKVKESVKSEKDITFYVGKEKDDSGDEGVYLIAICSYDADGVRQLDATLYRPSLKALKLEIGQEYKEYQDMGYNVEIRKFTNKQSNHMACWPIYDYKNSSVSLLGENI